MSVLSSLLVLILLCRALGEVFRRLQQPSLVGEILAGIILGPSCLSWIHPGPSLNGISELAMFLIILSAGLEMDFKQVLRCFRGKGLIVAILGFIIPFLTGSLIGLTFGLDGVRTVFLGLCISITALPVAVRILQGFDILDHPIARYAIAAAVVNDVVALFVLGVILKLPSGGSYGAIASLMAVSILKLSALAGVIVIFNLLIERVDRSKQRISRLSEWLTSFFGKEALLGILIAFVMAFGSLSEALGSHFAIGAFFGALLINKNHFLAKRYESLEESLNSMTSGFLAPVFFGYLGLEFSVSQLPGVGFVVAVLLVSVLTKMYAGWLGGRMVGLKGSEPLGLGIILNGRGVMELVVANIALEHNFISAGIFSTLVLMGIFTTLITPTLFRFFVLKSLDSVRDVLRGPGPVSERGLTKV